MKLVMVGMGYVGLVSAVCYAGMGHDVICYDVDLKKIQLLREGKCPIHEQGLSELLHKYADAGRLVFATSLDTVVDCPMAIIAVGTPPLENGAPDLTYVHRAIDALTSRLPMGAVVVMKSTVPVGTSKRIQRQMQRLGRDDLTIASFPEFLREGSAVEDTLHPSRLVFGVADAHSEALLRSLYPETSAPVIVCDSTTAEMVKYSSNAFLATKISFINEIANICMKVGADVQTVAEGMGKDPRIGPDFLKAGIGYGGSCFPKDTRALVRLADDIDYDFRVLKSVVEINQRQRLAPVRALKSWFPDLSGIVVGILGVAFKPGTDDVRESPAVDLATDLLSREVELRLCDPVVEGVIQVGRHACSILRDPYEALSGCDAAILITDWPQFKRLDWAKIRTVMRGHQVFDGRNFFEPAEVRAHGFLLENMGRMESHSTVPLS